MAIQLHLAASAPAAPGPGDSTGHPSPQALLGRGFSRERPRDVGFHAQGTFTKANRLVFPSPKASVCIIVQQKQKSTYRSVHSSASTSWPQGFGCIY